MSSGLAGFIQVSGLSVTREPETRKLGFLEVSVRNLIFPPILAALFCSHERVPVPQSCPTFPPNSPEVVMEKFGSEPRSEPEPIRTERSRTPI